MIKNFVVKVKQVQHQDRGLKNLLNYLEDEKRHPNGIIKIKPFDKNHFFKNTILNITEYNITKKAGRKSKNYADSFIFTIPPELHEKGKKNLVNLTKELLESIKKQINKQLPDNEKINLKNLINQIYLNVHTDKKHIHINVLFPRILKTDNGSLLSNRITNRKKFLHEMKQHWTHIVTKNLKLSVEDYTPTTNYKRGYKKSFLKEDLEKINEIKTKNENILKEIEEKEKEILKLDKLIEMKRSEIKEEVENLLKENEKRKEIAKEFQLLIRYYKSLTKEFYKEKNYEKAIEEYWKFKNKLEKFKKQNKIKVLQPVVEDLEKETQTIYESLQLY